jgi:hypothetical protein
MCPTHVRVMCPIPGAVWFLALLFAFVSGCAFDLSDLVTDCPDGSTLENGSCHPNGHDSRDGGGGSGSGGSGASEDGGLDGAGGADGESGMDGGGSGGTGGEGASGGAGGESGTGGSGGQPDAGSGGTCIPFSVDPKPIEVATETQVPYQVMVPKPVAVYFMLDKSGSMDDTEGNPPVRKWDTAVDAINTFVNDSNSEGINVALQYFSGTGPCDGSVYDTPAVPMGPLPDNAANISTSLAATAPGGNTPTEGALRGLTQFCIGFQAANTDVPCVGVFITDGRPTACNEDSNALVTIAQDAYANNDVRTFTVGMQGDTDFVLLDNIAMWGGTDCTPNPDGTANPADGHYCDVRPDSGMTLLQAVEAIRDAVTVLEERTEYRTEIVYVTTECEWGIPDLPGDVDFDADRVYVIVTKSGQDDLLVRRVTGETKCDDSPDGWYYDDPADPTRIIACPQTCDMLEAMTGEAVSLIFDC